MKLFQVAEVKCEAVAEEDLTKVDLWILFLLLAKMHYALISWLVPSTSRTFQISVDVAVPRADSVAAAVRLNNKLLRFVMTAFALIVIYFYL